MFHFGVNENHHLDELKTVNKGQLTLIEHLFMGVFFEVKSGASEVRIVDC